VPEFEQDLAWKMYTGSLALGTHAAGHGNFDAAAGHFAFAQARPPSARAPNGRPPQRDARAVPAPGPGPAG
jgi:hypothetical protein